MSAIPPVVVMLTALSGLGLGLLWLNGMYQREKLSRENKTLKETNERLQIVMSAEKERLSERIRAINEENDKWRKSLLDTGRDPHAAQRQADALFEAEVQEHRLRQAIDLLQANGYNVQTIVTKEKAT